MQGLLHRCKVKQLSNGAGGRLPRCVTVCDPMDCSPPGSSAHGALSGKNTGVGCHFLLQGNLPDPGIKPTSPAFSALAGGFFTTAPPGKPITKD